MRPVRGRPVLCATTILASTIVLSPSPTAAQSEGLGMVTFANSGAPRAQDDFLRGVLLLHNFEYEDAATAFRAAQEADAGFALGKPGPDPQSRAARAGTERERGYLPAVFRPPWELHAEILLAAKHAAEAGEASDEALARRPDRARSLLGRARASAAEGDRDTASHFYGRLLDPWKLADEGLEEVREARAYLAAG